MEKSWSARPEREPMIRVERKEVGAGPEASEPLGIFLLRKEAALLER